MAARWWYWSGCADIIALHGRLRLSGHPASEQSSRGRLKLFLACEGANAVISYAGRPVSGLDRHPPTREGLRLGSSLPCLKSQLAAPDLPDLSCNAVALTTQHHVTETYTTVPFRSSPYHTAPCLPAGRSMQATLQATWAMSYGSDVRFL